MGNKVNVIVKDPSKLLPIIRSYPLATVITSLQGTLEISHLPIVVETLPTGSFRFRGHLSTKNPQWRHLKNGAHMTLVFSGPNAYINSSWYVVDDVSTWNYISVQAAGAPVIEESYDGLLDILKATTNLTNSIYEDQWDFYIPEDLDSPAVLTAAIGGFSFETSVLNGRFKLSQSKSLEDQKRVIAELLKRKDENSKLVAQLMIDNIE